MLRTAAPLAVVLLAATLTAPAALAAPTTIGAQGRLATSAGGPVSDGVYAMKVSLYPTADAPQAVWEHTFLNVPVSGGLFAVVLGADGQPPLDDGLFASSAAGFVGVEVSGEPELPRRALLPAPYAVRAMSAAMADQAMTAGQAAKADTAATAEELSCTGCVTLQHLAPDVGAAFLSAAGGTLSGKLTAGAGVDLGGASLENAVLSGAKLAAVDVQNAGCGAAQLGAIALGQGDGKPYFCDGSAWRRLASCSGLCPGAELVACGQPIVNDCGDACTDNNSGDALKGTLCPTAQMCDEQAGQCTAALGTEAMPAVHCKAILDALPGSPTGAYWLDPDGQGGAPAFEGWCEMVLEGGGWTLVAAQHPQIQGADATPGLANVGNAAAGIAGDAPYNSTFLGRPYTELLAELPTEDVWLRITGFDVGKFEAEMADTAGETSANTDCQADVYTPNVKMRGKQPNGSVQETTPPAPLIAEVHHSAWNASAQTNWILAAGNRPPGSGSTGTWGMFGGGTVLRIDGIEVSNAKGRVYVR